MSEGFNRPSWDEYFARIAILTSERSNCIKRKVGSIVVKNNRILSLGYNGTPRGMLNCYEGGCSRCKNVNVAGHNLDLCKCLHAEENALLFNSQDDLKDSTIYITLCPCISCSKKIIQCNIKRVVYINNYNQELDKQSIEMLELCNIKVDKFSITLSS